MCVDWDAVKRIIDPTLSKYTARSNVYFTKSKYSSIGLSYNSCDSKWCSLQDYHLILELEHALRSFDMMFVLIKGIVKIMPHL